MICITCADSKSIVRAAERSLHRNPEGIAMQRTGLCAGRALLFARSA
jgi:hypothetical protein